MGAVGIAILALDRCCSWSFGFYVIVQVAYDLLQGAVVGVIMTYEGELTDGGYIPGVAKTLVALTSAVDIILLKGPAQFLGVDEITGPPAPAASAASGPPSSAGVDDSVGPGARV